MSHVIEPATSGRAKCRGCGQRIQKDELRFGERLPNPFAEGEMTLWFHVVCAAYIRPEPFLETMKETSETLERSDWLQAEARLGLAHRRLPRVRGAERASTGRARCRSCRKLIEKDGWRIALVYHEEGRFNPSGFIHARCAEHYLETTEIVDRARHFSPELREEDVARLRVALEGTD